MRANNKKTANKKTDTAATEERPDLGQRYGRIGISAVAAAVRYQSEAKNPAYAPVDIRFRELAEDVAA